MTLDQAIILITMLAGLTTIYYLGITPHLIAMFADLHRKNVVVIALGSISAHYSSQTVFGLRLGPLIATSLACITAYDVATMDIGDTWKVAVDAFISITTSFLSFAKETIPYLVKAILDINAANGTEEEKTVLRETVINSINRPWDLAKTIVDHIFNGFVNIVGLISHLSLIGLTVLIVLLPCLFFSNPGQKLIKDALHSIKQKYGLHDIPSKEN